MFVEQEHDRPEEHVFDVEVNGRYVFCNLDLAGARGRYTVERSIVATAAGGAGIIIRLNAITGRTTISGIMRRRR